jgi:hypothetical protein
MVGDVIVGVSQPILEQLSGLGKAFPLPIGIVALLQGQPAGFEGVSDILFAEVVFTLKVFAGNGHGILLHSY